MGGVGAGSGGSYLEVGVRLPVVHFVVHGDFDRLSCCCLPHGAADRHATGSSAHIPVRGFRLAPPAYFKGAIHHCSFSPPRESTAERVNQNKEALEAWIPHQDLFFTIPKWL